MRLPGVLRYGVSDEAAKAGAESGRRQRWASPTTKAAHSNVAALCCLFSAVCCNGPRGRYGLGPGDASQAPPPEPASPGPVAPPVLPPKRKARRSRRSPARGRARLGLVPRVLAWHVRRSKRRRIGRYFVVKRLLDGSIRVPGTLHQGGTILPLLVGAVKGQSLSTLHGQGQVGGLSGDCARPQGRSR
jgi:hypothetical protein